MTVVLKHDMRPTLNAEDAARQRFVSGLRVFVLNDLAGDMRRAYDSRVRPAYARSHGHEPADSAEVHDAIRSDVAFKVYSGLRVNAQKMVWESVLPVVEREKKTLNAKAAKASARRWRSTRTWWARNVSAIDVHFMPGSYVGRTGDTDVSPGAVYDQGLAVSSMGLMGSNLDDIGLSMSRYVSRKFRRSSRAAFWTWAAPSATTPCPGRRLTRTRRSPASTSNPACSNTRRRAPHAEDGCLLPADERRPSGFSR